ncbi:MAG: DUF523 domain-containing protein [Erysipelotrichaceae bacterium]|nr:DUF523 domain-containing protein [Erysipelotrichaceae bacterium]
MKIGISACLMGYKYRYDGTHRKNEELLDILKGHELIPVCPELCSGFSVPHDPIELKGDRAYLKDGSDVTDKLMKGCDLSLEKIKNCDLVILKTKSPSCGYKKIYDGSFSGKLIDGNGMFARSCLENNIRVFSENDLNSIREYTAQ